jgi:galactokinase
MESTRRAQPQVILKKFEELFDSQPILVRSPGRINLIGEHTDYNDGFVMPAAIDRQIFAAIDFAEDDHSTLYSSKHNEFFSFHTSDPARVKSPVWANYLLGVVRKFKDQGYSIKPFNCLVDGDVPTGAGLSSSAALECSFAFALNHLNQLKIPRLDLIKIAQWAEHVYAGVKCGIMDQFASMMGSEGKAFVLDCRSLQYRYVPVDLSSCSIVLCDSMVKHSLASTAYNTRREECEAGVKIIGKYYPDIKSLRDATLAMVEELRSEFPGKVYDRCKYVVQENERVVAASKDLEQGDLVSFGKRMYDSHHGLSTMYEVSCPELDFLVEEAAKTGMAFGARMMGGGFGGCTINLVTRESVKDFVEKISQAYLKTFNVSPNVYIVSLSNGTSLI